MEPFRNLLGPALVRDAAADLHRAWRGFPRDRFERLALDGLDALPMKGRADHIAAALVATLPHDDAAAFARACDVVEAALAPPLPADGALTPAPGGRGLAGWVVWPLGEFVARAGLGHPRRALAALHALTQRLTAEYAIRPFLVAHEALTLGTLRAWTTDPSAHVRRLCSEGSRPRLPWGLRLQRFVADPSPTLPILDALLDDPSPYVRRSVANHVNDVAKDHPDLVVRWVAARLPDAPAPRIATLRHASRTLVKRGHRPMLALWGAGAPLRGEARLRLGAKAARVGDRLALTATLTSTARRAQRLVVDYVVHHVRADGTLSPKVFKGWTVTLEPGATWSRTTTHSLAKVTTRRYYAGRHRVGLQVNGEPVAEAAFRLDVGP